MTAEPCQVVATFRLNTERLRDRSDELLRSFRRLQDLNNYRRAGHGRRS